MAARQSRAAAIGRHSVPRTPVPPVPTGAAGKEQPRERRLSYTVDDQPGFLLRVALRRHTGFFSRMMIEGLTAPQFSTLAKLYEVGSCSQNHLGRLIAFDSATITGVVERLRGRALIASREDPVDRRRSILELTDEGYRVAEAAIERVKDVSGKTFSPLTLDEKKSLARLLRKVADAEDLLGLGRDRS